VLSAWLDELPAESPAWPRLRAIQRDEARNCARLIDLLIGMGAKPSLKTGDFARRARETSGWANRLAFLNRGQAWVVRRLSAALPRIAASPGRKVLERMLDSHRDNIVACDVVPDELDREHGRASRRPLPANTHRSVS
jgi:nitronate monooxygenase